MASVSASVPREVKSRSESRDIKWYSGGMTDKLQKKVDRALDAAVFENGYEALMTYGAREVAIDLCTYDPELENEDLDAVEKRVLDYKAWYGSGVTGGPRQR